MSSSIDFDDVLPFTVIGGCTLLFLPGKGDDEDEPDEDSSSSSSRTIRFTVVVDVAFGGGDLVFAPNLVESLECSESSESESIAFRREDIDVLVKRTSFLIGDFAFTFDSPPSDESSESGSYRFDVTDGFVPIRVFGLTGFFPSVDESSESFFCGNAFDATGCFIFVVTGESSSESSASYFFALGVEATFGGSLTGRLVDSNEESSSDSSESWAVGRLLVGIAVGVVDSSGPFLATIFDESSASESSDSESLLFWRCFEIAILAFVAISALCVCTHNELSLC